MKPASESLRLLGHRFYIDQYKAKRVKYEMCMWCKVRTPFNWCSTDGCPSAICNSCFVECNEKFKDNNNNNNNNNSMRAVCDINGW